VLSNHLPRLREAVIRRLRHARRERARRRASVRAVPLPRAEARAAARFRLLSWRSAPAPRSLVGRYQEEAVMKAVVEAVGKVGSRVQLGDHQLVFDQPVGVSGGENHGPSPLDVFGVSIAACAHYSRRRSCMGAGCPRKASCRGAVREGSEALCSHRAALDEGAPAARADRAPVCDPSSVP
jgi:hypothetical protein